MWCYPLLSVQYAHAWISIEFHCCNNNLQPRFINFVLITEDGAYNAVWDDKVLLCYSLLQCKCDKLVGVLVHSSITGDGVESLNEKVSGASCKYTL